MPYLNHPKKVELTRNEVQPKTAGELNYMITQLIIEYIEGNGLSYDKLNDVVGALTCVKDEFNRRVIIPYEDSKIELNGDVYPESLCKQ